MKIAHLLNEQHQFLSTKQDIDDWFRDYNHDTEDTHLHYKINSDMSVDVQGYVNLNDTELQHIPINFNHIQGDFSCDDNNLTSLFGCPKAVTGSFYCHGNKLTTLEHGPTQVGRTYDCSNNPLLSLDHAPSIIHQALYCTDLNSNISFSNVHKIFSNVGRVQIPMKPHKGLIMWILIPQIRNISLYTQQTLTPELDKTRYAINNILNKHIKTKDILACQEELIDAGFADWAKL